MSTAIHINSISKNFGSFPALDNVSFEVPEKTIFGVLGPNGAGKTTLFSVIAGFLPPTSGNVVVLGETEIAKLRGRLSILPQDALFQANIPIFDQLVYFSRLLGRSRDDAEYEVYQSLKRVNLDKFMFRESATLSHGMYKRLALAQAFLGEPEVIILDEPTSGLDVQGAMQIRSLIKELQSQTTIIVSSHNMNEMRDLCEHVAFLNQGKLVASGPVDTVTGTSLSVECRLGRPLTEDEIEKLKKSDTIRQIQQTNKASYSIGFLHTLTDEEAETESRKLLRQILDMDISIHALNETNRLEVEYLRLTGSNNQQRPSVN
ncbi:MAG: ABC transporter ATP-binding protein [Spirochaetales bacterium]|nr:ABC transporter ATP-binding protein [Spirochaetales bacterium]